MDSDSIRRAFVQYFVERGHLHLPGLPLVTNDPSVTTLFAIAGMQQMIPYFLGREEPPSKRIVTVQPAVRTVDIDEVGDDTHLTYLEMLGNFSVGDYFKREAVGFTWDFLTRVMGVPADRWWATIYPGDEEAREGWIEAGMPAERIGETEENWWGPPGPYGPCGPDSEIHFDRGIERSCGREDCRPENECCDRFIETWNNVFMTYYQEEDGERRPLPWKNIDTGMGFERLVAVVQGGDTVYDTDLFRPIFETVTRLTGTQYGKDERTTRSMRIIADHSRSVTFIIAAGVLPSAEGRGYVLRRLMRRAILHGRLLGLDRPFLTEPVGTVIDIMSGYHTQLPAQRQRILDVVRQEESRFLHTLSRGLGIFEEMAGRAQADGKVISGDDAFVLSDTYGFPLELTRELAGERSLSVDEPGFERALEEQRRLARSRQATKAIGTSPQTYSDLARMTEPTVFTGYDELQRTTEVVGIIAGGESVARAEAGHEVEILLAATPFYAESGGQVGDTGTIRGDSGWARVTDTQRNYAAFISHTAVIEEGAVSVGDIVTATVDTERRLHILPHHSGTHLLHKALQEVLGPEATQAGSLVAPDRLRFDFRWPRPMTDEEVREVQDRVNAAIWANLPVRKEAMPYDEALASGAMALFGEKYGDVVRVVSMGDWSKELCGGTHVGATGDIGLLLITSETGIGSGIRRIEAVAGAAAYAFVNDLREQLHGVARSLGSPVDNVLGRSEQVMHALHESEKRVEALTRRLAGVEAAGLLDRAERSDGRVIVGARIEAESIEYLQAVTEAVKSRLDRGVVVLGAAIEGKPAFTAAVTKNLTTEGVSAATMLRAAARQAQGGAGGHAEFAQGGGRDTSKIDDVIASVVETARGKAGG